MNTYAESYATIDTKYLTIDIPEEYSSVLENHHLQYRIIDYYLHVGEPVQLQGWVIDLSAIAIQLVDLFKTVLPILINEKVPFKIVASKEIAKGILNGQLGYILLGKVISIYTKNDQQAKELAIRLIEQTKCFTGPCILTDRHLGSIVYTRFGAHKGVFNPTASSNEFYFNSVEPFMIAQDTYSIPFIMPKEIHWPYDNITSLIPPKPAAILQDRYRPMKVLKEDARGNVNKALHLKKWFRVTWCLIKEGKQHMHTDEYGRNIKHRLQWQFDLQKDLYGTIPIPKAYELFEENGDSYLAMEFIKGRSLDEVITDTFHNTHWSHLKIKDHLLLINYAIYLTELISKLHEKAYVHRDINPCNFIISKKGKLTLIDLELAYSIKNKQPHPPFRYGTMWFMSPEQQESKVPTIKEDIYAYGGTMIAILTGLLPSKFSIFESKVLRDQLTFFIPHKTLVEVIAQCLEKQAELRPNLNTLKTELLRYRDLHTNQRMHAYATVKNPVPNDEELSNTIQASINALSTSLMIDEAKLWMSRTVQDANFFYYQAQGTSIYPGFHTGVSGISYMLSKMSQAGFTTDTAIPSYQKGYHFVHDCIKNSAQLPAGLYFGSAGIAISLVEGIKSGLISDRETAFKLIRSCIQNTNISGFGVANGLAGKGIALLKSLTLLDKDLVKPLLDECISGIIEEQKKDGSWVIRRDDCKNYLKINGFGHGIAGITCFLLEYLKRYKDNLAEEAVNRALFYLLKKSEVKNGRRIFRNVNKISKSDQGLHAGRLGILLAFIKGYELFQNPTYRQIAESGLGNFNRYIISRDLTLGTGLAGLGETYLEAFVTFKNEEWNQRAGWIVQFMLHQFQQQPDGSRYWVVDHLPNSTADLAIGNAGVIHFLGRYKDLDSFTHPLLPL